MEQSPPGENKIVIDIKLLSQFVYALNIARRQMVAYPPRHPSVETAVGLAMERFAVLECNPFRSYPRSSPRQPSHRAR